jgi:hypothetical protein
MHLDEETLQRLLHGELSQSEEKVAREHVILCDECRGRLEHAEREEATTAARLRELDQLAPLIDFGSVADRARIDNHGRAAAQRRRRRAASIILAAGIAGAAYAIPGSPVPEWVDRVVTWVGGPRAAVRPISEPAGIPESGESGGAGIAVAPGSQLTIIFESSQKGGLARVSLTGGDEVVVRASSRAATFTSGADRLVIESHATSGTFEIEIPRTAPRVEIFLRGTRLFLKDGGRVVAREGTDSSGAYVIRLDPSGS